MAKEIVDAKAVELAKTAALKTAAPVRIAETEAKVDNKIEETRGDQKDVPAGEILHPLFSQCFIPPQPRAGLSPRIYPLRLRTIVFRGARSPSIHPFQARCRAYCP